MMKTKPVELHLKKQKSMLKFKKTEMKSKFNLVLKGSDIVIQNGFNIVLKTYNLKKEFVAELFDISMDTVNSWNRKTVKMPTKYVKELSNILEIPEKYLLLEKLSEVDRMYIEKYYLEHKLKIINDNITFYGKEQEYNDISIGYKIRCGKNYYYIGKDDVVAFSINGSGQVIGNIYGVDGENIKFKRQNGDLLNIYLGDIYCVNIINQEYIRGR